MFTKINYQAILSVYAPSGMMHCDTEGRWSVSVNVVRAAIRSHALLLWSCIREGSVH